MASRGSGECRCTGRKNSIIYTDGRFAENADRPFSILNFRRYDYDRYRKTVIAGKAPLGGSAGQRSGKGTKDSDTAADPGGCDFGESITADNPNDIGTVGGIFMGSIQSSTIILCALGNRSASFLSRRAHLLTTSSEQTPYHSLCLSGQSSLIPLFLLSPKSLSTFRGPFRRWYFRWKSCALRGGCGFCGSLMDNATS